MKTLVVIKPFTYNTRRLVPGDYFEVKTERDAALLTGIKKARLVETREDNKIPAPEKNLIEKFAKPVLTPVSEKEEEIILDETPNLMAEENNSKSEEKETTTEEVTEGVGSAEEETKDDVSVEEDKTPAQPNVAPVKRRTRRKK